MKTVFITGATSGIGKACAELFAKNNFELILVGRRTERLSELKAELEQEYDVKSCAVFQLDVRNQEDVQQLIYKNETLFSRVDILINNAGLALGLSRIQDGDISDWDTMIDTNIKGLLYVTKAMSKYFIDKKEGHIINIGSIAGKEVYLNGNVYCATKHAVDALTKSMRIDLLPYNVKVTGVCPGAVETEFSKVRFHGDAAAAAKVYEGYTPLSAFDIAEVIYFSATRPSHVCLNDILVMPTVQASATYWNK